MAERSQVALEKAVSTGMAFSSYGSFDLPAMLLQADQALYRAKAEGRNRSPSRCRKAHQRAMTSRRPAAASCASDAAAPPPEPARNAPAKCNRSVLVAVSLSHRSSDEFLAAFGTWARAVGGAPDGRGARGILHSASR